MQDELVNFIIVRILFIRSLYERILIFILEEFNCLRNII
jgi:hypothetical protein